MAEPGSIIIRPVRRDAEQSPQAFYKILDHFRRRGDLPLDLLADLTNDQTLYRQQNISKRATSQNFSAEARSAILRYIFNVAGLLFGKRRKESRAVPDAAFFALINLFNVPDEIQDDARAQAVGTYKFWRHSAEHRGEYVYGRMDVVEEKSGALKVQVRQVQQPTQGLRGDEENYTGYMICLPKMFFAVLHGEKTHDARVLLLPAYKVGEVGTSRNRRSVFEGSNLHLLTLEGFAAGIDGSKSFFSPVHLSFVDDVDELNLLDAQIDVIALGDQRMPNRVANMLERNGPVRQLEPLSTPYDDIYAAPLDQPLPPYPAPPSWAGQPYGAQRSNEAIFASLARASATLDQISRADPEWAADAGPLDQTN